MEVMVMFAIIKAGGKQYTVKPGDEIVVNKLDVESGDCAFEEVLAVENDGKFEIGQPTVAGAKVEAEIVNHFKGEKILVFKKKRRKDYKKRYGHRDNLTKVKIKNIVM